MRILRPLVALLLTVTAVACSTTTGPSVTLTAPAIVSPSNGLIINSTSQPITLVARNAVTASGTVTVSDTFEVASDPDFGKIVFSKVVLQDPSGQTKVVVDPLSSNATYYWRVRAAAGNSGLVSGSAKFSIAVTLQPPTLVSPATGRLFGDLEQPVTLVAQNPALPTSVGSATAVFEVSTDASFGTVVATKSVPAVAGPLSVTLDSLPASAAYNWRVRVVADGTLIAGAASQAATFRIGRAISSGPYRLTVNIPAQLNSWPSAHSVTIDGDLKRSQSVFVFRQSEVLTNLYWGMASDSGNLKGTANSGWSDGWIDGITINAGYVVHLEISGRAGYFCGICGPQNPVPTPADVAGTVRPDDGVMTGQLNAYVIGEGAYDLLFGFYAPPMKTFSWTLAPR